VNDSFWNMGGYAFYVWGSYGAALAVFAWNVVVAHLECRAVMRRVREAAGEAGRS
jgi:heme exporter protein CcmD